jgi:hypothetical protein
MLLSRQEYRKCNPTLCHNVQPILPGADWGVGKESHTFGQCSSTRSTLRHLKGYTKTSYINQNETQGPLELWTSSDTRTHEDSFLNWGAGMPETILYGSILWYMKHCMVVYCAIWNMAHPNHLAVNLFRLPDNRRLRRFLPTDLPDRF